MNGGFCKTDKVGQRVCVCPTGFAGLSCEINIDDCAANQCENDSKCIDKVAGYMCDCQPGKPDINKNLIPSWFNPPRKSFSVRKGTGLCKIILAALKYAYRLNVLSGLIFF